MRNKSIRTVCFVASLFLCLTAQAQQAADSLLTCTAKVVEADTGEPMPLVGVYVSNDNTTVTNFDGEFSIKARPADRIRLTCVGRKTVFLQASALPDTVRMQMLAGSLSEVTVKAFEGTLLQISKQMEKAFNRRKAKSEQYFYRQTTVIDRKQDIVEAFIRARSAVNLRDIEFISGRHGRVSKETWDNSIFNNMNLHHVLEMGAMTLNVPFWNGLLFPLMPQRFGVAGYQKFYDINIENVNSDDQNLYRITLNLRPEAHFEEPCMEGTLYVERGTLRTLAFDGKIRNVSLIFNRSQLESSLTVHLNLDFHIDYRHDHGYPEVADLSMQASFDNFQTRTMLFNLSDHRPMKARKRSVSAGENMIGSIDEAGYDSVFWAQNEVVKRTAEEQRIAEGVIEKEQAEIDSARAFRESLPPLERMADRLKRFGENIPQEKVYLHTDNTCYFLGDTIWFAAYTRATNTDRPSRISRVLYVELLNHDGYLVERKLVEMVKGSGSGFFALPDTLYSGYFELRAYTRWQLNWGQTEHKHERISEEQFYNADMAKDYFRDYEKLYSRVFPVYDRPEKPGDYTRDMTLRPLRRQFKDAPPSPDLVLSLFPEGGNLVAGEPCRVAFEAALSDGEVRSGQLQLLANKQVVATAVTENRGRGSFVFTPEDGVAYEVLFTDSADGRAVRQRIRDIQSDGVSLQVHRQGDQWLFDIRPHGLASQQPLGFTIMHEGRLQHFQTLDDNCQLAVSDSQLPAGVNQATVYDSIGHIYADRLFFVTRPELAKPTLAISGLKDRYAPYEQVEIDVKCKIQSIGQLDNPQSIGQLDNPQSIGQLDNLQLDNCQSSSHFSLLTSHSSSQSSISLSVRDAAGSDPTFDSGNILTEMLLASEIKGFIPHPEWFFQSDDDAHRRGLDLLMLTQGWRRFRWRDMAVPHTWELSHPAEHTQMVTGSVNLYQTDDPYADENQQTIDDFQAFQQDPMKKRDKDAFSAANPEKEVGRKDLETLVESGKTFSTDNKVRNRRNTKFLQTGKPRREVLVHAEFVPIGGGKGIVGEATTKAGNFKIDLPRFYGDCVFFLTAADTTQWSKKHPLWLKKYKQHEWIKMEDDEYERVHEDAEFYVRLLFPYPRWVKPYTYYQIHNAAPQDADASDRLTTDGARLLNEVTVRSRRNRLNHIDLHKPVCVLDAYEAGNAAMDAGLITKLHQGESTDDGEWGLGNMDEIAYAVIANVVGDMGTSRRFDTALYFDTLKFEAFYPNRQPPHSYWRNTTTSPGDHRRYSRLEYIDKIYLYSDYSPRREGDQRFEQSNQPSVEVSLRRYPNWDRRATYRDRRYILHGFALQEDFYHPDYHRRPPQEGQTDHRRTLYWNPNLQLDSHGAAHIVFFNNGQTTTLQVEAEGQAANGALLYNR